MFLNGKVFKPAVKLESGEHVKINSFQTVANHIPLYNSDTPQHKASLWIRCKTSQNQRFGRTKFSSYDF